MCWLETRNKTTFVLLVNALPVLLCGSDVEPMVSQIYGEQ